MRACFASWFGDGWLGFFVIFLLPSNQISAKYSIRRFMDIMLFFRIFCLTYGFRGIVKLSHPVWRLLAFCVSRHFVIKGKICAKKEQKLDNGYVQ